MNRIHVALAFAGLVAVAVPIYARGVGEETYLISSEVELISKLGETRGTLIDAQANVMFRYNDGAIVAAALDKPDIVLWTAACKPIVRYQSPTWELLPKLLVVICEDRIEGFDRATGKLVYTADAVHFTHNPPFLETVGADQLPTGIAYLIDDLAQHKRSANDVRDSDADLPDREPRYAATLAKFDLASGKLVWEAPIVTRTGAKLLSPGFTAEGGLRGRRPDDVFIFDPASGKSLEKEPTTVADPVTVKPASKIETLKDGIAYVDQDGKRIWEFKQAAEHRYPPLLGGDVVVVPQASTNKLDSSLIAQVIALRTKDGAVLWRYTLPHVGFADQYDLQVTVAKKGYLIRYHWMILD